jgi:hypothetical protein
LPEARRANSNHIPDGTAPMSKHFFDVVAKHKQEDHVAKHVPEIEMQELMGDQGERWPKSANGVASQGYRNDRSVAGYSKDVVAITAA